MGKNISKNLSGKYSQKLLDHAKQSATDALKTISKSVLQKAAEATVDLIGNKIIKLRGFQKIHNRIIQTVTNELDKEIPKERYIFPEERQKIIDDLRLI